MKQADIEKKILAFWKQDRTFRKSIKKDSPQGDFVFYDGPPFATGTPHYGHIVASLIKDMVPRYWTMRGYRVERRWGWDCHGLPIENIVEKEHGFKHKKDILAFGVDKFNEEARSKVLMYVKEWREVIDRLGRWVDFDNDYKTMDPEFMESVWWVFKELYEKGFLYEAYRSMHICPRCETTLAQSEVAQGYKDVKDLSVVAKFELSDEPGTYLLAWTTTPWTLPGNAALAVGEKIEYIKIRDITSNEAYIVSKNRHREILKYYPELDSKDYNSKVKLFKGSYLIGKKYKPLFPYYDNIKTENHANAFKIYAADFVNTEEGTGIVHIAPAFGEDDMALGKKENLPFIQHVGMDGIFKAEVTDFAGLPVKHQDAPDTVDHPEDKVESTDVKIIKYLAAKGLLFSKEKYTHSYPHCWRCDSPLLNYATSSWFVAVEKIKKDLLKNAEKIEWMPEHLKDGRFGQWLAGARDWSISRQRFWGSVLPIWKSADGKEVRVMGSIEELRQAGQLPITKIIFIRHGESEKNLATPFSSALNKYPLTKLGRAQAQAASQLLAKEKVAAVISSPLQRARETAAIIAKDLGLEVSVDERWREENFGEWEERTYANFESDEAYLSFRSLAPKERFAYRIGESGETAADVIARTKPALQDLLKKYAGQTVVVVGHGINNAALSHLARNIATEKFVHLADYTAYAQPQVYYLDEAGQQFDLHKHYIDNITIPSASGRGVLRRIPDVLDCWFEAGSMPYGQLHYPFANEDKFKANFPAEFIAEGVDQTRAWFYYLHVLATALKKKPAFKHVIVNGIVLAEDGKKMSKRLQNYPDPLLMFDKYGADAVRYYLATAPVLRAEDFCFSEKGVDEVVKKVILILYNVLAFYQMYAGEEVSSFKFQVSKNSHILDQWIVAKLNQLTSEVTNAYDKYDLNKATRPIAEFVNELSTWYLRRSRDRFKGDDAKDKASALATLKYVLENLSKIMAPVMPFTAEHVWQELGNKESIHLESWPKAGKVDEKIIDNMFLARKVVELGLAERAKAGLKIRQPLAGASVGGGKLGKETEVIVGDELNIKAITYREDEILSVVLDIAITPELKLEGHLRELVRTINGMRKNAGLTPGDIVEIEYQTDSPELKKTFIIHGEELKKAVIAKKIVEGGNGDEIEINGEKLKIAISSKL